MRRRAHFADPPGDDAHPHLRRLLGAQVEVEASDTRAGWWRLAGTRLELPADALSFATTRHRDGEPVLPAHVDEIPLLPDRLVVVHARPDSLDEPSARAELERLAARADVAGVIVVAPDESVAAVDVQELAAADTPAKVRDVLGRRP